MKARAEHELRAPFRAAGRKKRKKNRRLLFGFAIRASRLYLGASRDIGTITTVWWSRETRHTDEDRG